jgi:TPR repeat protein
MEFYCVAQKRISVNAKFDPGGTSRGNNTPELITCKRLSSDRPPPRLTLDKHLAEKQRQNGPCGDGMNSDGAAEEGEDGGHAPAQRFLGSCYYHEDGVEKDDVQARQ